MAKTINQTDDQVVSFLDLDENIFKTSVDWHTKKGSRTITFDFNVSAVSPAFIEWLDSHSAKRGSLIDALCKLVSGWNVTGLDGQPIPFTRDHLEGRHPEICSAIPTGLLQMMLDKVLSVFQLGEWRSATNTAE